MLSLKIFNLKGPDSLTKRECKKLTSNVRKKIRDEIGIRITYTLREEADPYPELDGSVNRPLKYNKIFQFMKAKGRAPNEILVAVLGPVHNGGFKYTTGGSSGIGVLHRPDCTSIVSCWNGNWSLGVMSLVHELGHIIGARHTTTADIMNYLPTQFPFYEQLKFGDASKAQIEEYLEGAGR